MRRFGIALFLLIAGFGVAAEAQTGIFTYQGRLTDGTSAANGPYEMQFSLYSVVSGPGQIGSTITIISPPVTVTNGVFTVNLDFSPATPFATGADRWLEIAVRKVTDPPGFTTLTPRQQIMSSPYSIRTASASSADTLSVTCISCVKDAQIDSISGSKVTGTVASADGATTAGNVTGVVQIANGGTGSSTKNFTDLTTNQTIAGRKTFVDPIFGDGSQLTNVAGTFKWQTVSGLSQQALPNNGYVAGDAGQVTITLPTAPNVGDVVRVSAFGTGGWKIAQNAGQSIIGTNIGLTIQNWTPGNTSGAWRSLASSADGAKLVAAAGGAFLYTSTDSGATWVPRLNDAGRNWQSVASSSDGSKLVAVVDGGQIYTSTDSGVNWTPRESNRNWSSVASSGDGTKLVAAVNGGQIYTSINSGAIWTARENNRPWKSVATSADGTKLVAVGAPINAWTSIDSGVTWNPQGNPQFWQAVASSADGTKLVAAVNNGQIFTSVDSGVNWIPRESSRQWSSVASSADGARLIAAAGPGRIYTSTDSGVTWAPNEYDQFWAAVASSADGTKLAAARFGGQIYTFNTTASPSPHTTTIGPAGFLTGGRFTAIELQYIGNGQFLPISYVGTFTGF